MVFKGGDADTNCSVAGALLGCKLGYDKLPESWLNDLAHKEWLDEKLYKQERWILTMLPDFSVY